MVTGNESINVKKRNDRGTEPLNIEKIHEMVEYACEDITGVSASQVEMNSGLQFYDGMSTDEIQQILIKSASDLISLDNPNYQYVAARLLLYSLRKQIFHRLWDHPHIYDHVKKCVDLGVYDSEILNWYDKKDFDRMENWVTHERDYDFTYAGLRQVIDKYLVQDRSTNEVFETPQFMYMMIAATLFAKYTKNKRMSYVKKYYDATSKFKINVNKKSFKSESNLKSKKDLIQKTTKLILNSKKTVIVAGGGIKYNSKFKSVTDLAEFLNVPIVTAAGHGDAIPFSHKLNAGQMGPRGNLVASRLVKEAELIIALGTRLGFNSTFYSYDNINKKAKIIQVELEKKMLGRYFPISIGIHGDAANVANQMLNDLKKQKKILSYKEWTNNFLLERSKFLINRDNIKSKNYPIQPNGLFKELRKVLPKNSAITLDAGTLCLQATDALEYYNPPSLFTPLDFGLVGFSFACGLGIKVAKPNKTVVSLMGDGGFGMTISELSTAVEHGINTITIVMNNKSWGAEKAYQKDFYGERYLGADIQSPPFDEVAKLYGAKGIKVKKLSEVNQAVKSALKANKPVVIDVDVDPKALYSFRRDSFTHRIKK